jgi:hypothetical protein
VDNAFSCFTVDQDESKKACNDGGSCSGCGTFDLGDWDGEWICIEHEYDTATGLYRIFVTTQDGTYDEDCVVSNNAEADDIAVIDYLGHYGYNSGRTSATYFRISELVMDDEYIGPPSGFGDGEPDPTPPKMENLTISNGNVY